MTAAVKKKQRVNLATRIADCSFDPGSRNYDVFHVNESSYLASRIGFLRSGTSVALWLHKDGWPRGVVLRPSQKMFEEMIGNRR